MSLKDTNTRQMLNGITQRIEQVRQHAQLSRLAFCQKIGFSYPRYYHITGERASRPSVDLIGMVVQAMGVSPAWLLQGQGSMFETEGSANPQGYAMIPLLRVEASAGGGSFVQNEEEIETFLAFQREWIRRELSASVKNLSLIRVQGDSMAPTLSSGDVVLLNRGAIQPYVDGIYALRLGEALLVKRLQFLPKGKVVVGSDNSTYQPYTLSLDGTEDFAIIGQVVWAGKQF